MKRDSMNESPNRDVVVFTEALRLPSAERATYLERACGGDIELRRKVEALLEGHAQVGDFMEDSLQTILPRARGDVPAGEKPGDHIGRYKLLQQIGEGGCGIVFMAEQEVPVRRRVALKIIKPGMDTRSVIARFEAERQALALMDHPNIAKIFDAGATESGRPYFVMEVVRGIKITDYCDQHSLTTQERLKLFVQVCQAVQHAHQKGIIHRDIKPSNILVTQTEQGDPLPVVIDFGIAKATTNQRLTDKTLFTAFEMLIGTPAYMSPEQAALTSVDVDTRTDIYSLGALLYELLTGSTPFDTGELLKSGLDEIRRVIREQEPVFPSMHLSKLTEADLTTVAQSRHSQPPALIRTINGDLDWIVMKTLEKDRARRYPTAHSLSLDVQRFLANEAISARPPSKVYRFFKLAARNKLLFSGVALTFLLLAISLVTTIRWLMIERHTRQQMQKQVEMSQLDALGWQHYYEGNFPAAEQALLKVLALRRQFPDVEHTSQFIRHLLMVHMFESTGEFDKIKPFLAEYVPPSLLSSREYRIPLDVAINALARHGLWTDADALAEVRRGADPADHNPYHMRAPLLVAKNDIEGYRRLCGEIISRFRDATDPLLADKMAKDCLILSNSGVDLKSVIALADVAISRGSNSPALPYFRMTKALAEYRLGHYQEGADWARLAATGPILYAQVEAAAVIAMSQFKLNQLDASRVTLSECNMVIREQLPKPGEDLQDDWPDWIIARALRDEAERLIEVGNQSNMNSPSK
jgi:serine/threonine protein kinase